MGSFWIGSALAVGGHVERDVSVDRLSRSRLDALCLVPAGGFPEGGEKTSPGARAGPASNQVYVRAERSGLRDGRVYRTSFTGSDGKGGTCEGAATVAVSHDQGKPAVDSAPPSFDSFGP
jgi:hypothetical protein